MQRQTHKVSVWPNLVSFVFFLHFDRFFFLLSSRRLFFVSLVFGAILLLFCSTAGSSVGSLYLLSPLPLSLAQPRLILSLLIQVTPQVLPFFLFPDKHKISLFLSMSAHFMRSNHTMLSARERTSETVLTVAC